MVTTKMSPPQENVDAMFDMGTMYEDGELLPYDTKALLLIIT